MSDRKSNNAQYILGAGALALCGCAAYAIYVKQQKEQKRREKKQRLMEEAETMMRSEEPFECPVCFDNRVVSCESPCGHSICAHCSLDMFTKGVNKKCAFCRKPLPNDRRQYKIKFHALPDGDYSNLDLAFPLHSAVFMNNVQMTQWLLEHGADPNSDPYGAAPPVYFSCVQGAREITDLLIEYGADVTATDSFGRNMVHGTARAGNAETMGRLIKLGVSVNESTRNGEAPIHAAVVADSMECLKLLLESGADINAITEKKTTAAILAVSQGNLEMLKYLIDMGASYDTSFLTLVASGTGRVEILEFLHQELGAEMDSFNEIAAPIHSATENGHEAALRYLLENGADPDVPANDPFKNHPLLLAAAKGHVGCVRALIEHGAQLESTNGARMTALFGASEGGSLEIVQQLVEAGAEFKQTVQRIDDVPATESCFSLAMQGRHYDIAEYLAGLGADVNHTVFRGCRPIHYACMSGQKEAVELLLSHGAQLHHADDSGFQAIQYATACGHEDITEMLILAGADDTLPAAQLLGA